MSEHLAIRTLGGLAVQRDGTPIEFETQKEAALLVYLACTGRTHPREVLAEMLWEERTQSQALANLRHVLGQLRQRVDPYVTISRQSVAMNTESDWWLDVTAFENQLDAAGGQDVDTLETAMDLYQGEFLAGIYVDSAAFEDWMRLERERLRFRAMETLDILTGIYLNQRDHAKGIARATHLLQMDTLREETYQQLMHLLAQSGQRAQALVQYETCRRVLEEELGVSPLPATTALFNRIRGGEVVAAPDEAEKPLPVDIVSDMVTNPYKGLRAFEEADAAEFFGREALTERLLASLASDTDWARFLAVVGPSGSGKSSVVRAGVVPALRRGAIPGSEDWLIASMLPGPHPFDEFEIMLTRAIPTAPPNAMEHLRRDGRGLLRAVRMCLPNDAAETLIVIDQFEEVFTLVDDPAEARSFIDSLYVAATTPRSPVRILITLRADFYDRPLMIPDFSELVRQRNEVVVPMTPEELERAVVGPADQVGVQLEPGLVTEIVAEVSQQPGALPMMEYALTELFDRRVDHTLTLEGYQAIGGALGALARRADEVYERLSTDRQEATRQLFLRLVTLGEGTEDTRRRTRQAELLSVGGSAMQAALHAFDRSRLLTFDREPVTHQPRVELAHEAIIREWGRLREWLDDNRQDIRQQRTLAAATREWIQAKRDLGFLLHDTRLAQFEDWAQETQIALTADEREFLAASSAENLRQRARRRRVRNAILASAIGLSVMMTILALFALGQRNQAQNARDNAERAAEVNLSIALASSAREVLVTGDRELALALAVEANRIDNPPPVVQRTLYTIAYEPGMRWYSTVEDLPNFVAEDVTFSPDGKYAAAGFDDFAGDALGRVMVFESATGQLVHSFEAHKTIINALAFTPDGHYLFSGSQDATHDPPSMDTILIQWDLTTGEQVRVFPVTANVDALATSPDGQYLLSAGGPWLDDTPETTDEFVITMWDITTGEQVRTFVGHVNRIGTLAFLPDGKRFVSGVMSASADKVPDSLILWDVESGQELRRFDTQRATWRVVVSADGSRVLAGHGRFPPQSVVEWDLETGEVLRESEAFNTIVSGLAYSANERTALIGTQSGSILLWDMTSGDLREGLEAADVAVDVAFSPDGTQALVGGPAHAALYDLNHAALVSTHDFDDRLGNPSIASINNDHLLATTMDNYLVEIDLASGEFVRELPIPIENPYVNGGPFNLGASSDWQAAIVSAGIWGTEPVDVYLVMHRLTGDHVPLDFESDTLATGYLTPQISPDGRFVLGNLTYSADALVSQHIVWDSTTQEETARLNGLGVSFFLPNSRHVISSPNVNPTILIWDALTGEPIAEYPTTAYTILHVSPDGQQLVVGDSQDTLSLFDLATGESRFHMSGHDCLVPETAVQFTSDMRYLISADWCNIIVVWDLTTGEEVRRLEGRSGVLEFVALRPATGTVLTFSSPVARFSPQEQGPMVAQEWDLTVLDLDELLAWTFANRHVREFTCEERVQYRIEPLCE